MADHGRDLVDSAAQGGVKSRALAVVLIAGAIRLIVAGLTPVFPDETYYWDWSRHLQTGYFDHPPLVAFLIKFGTLLFGATPFGVRVGPVLAGIAATAFIAATAKRIGGAHAGELAAVVFVAMPLSAAGLVLATPDAGLLLGSSAVIYCVVRAFEHAAGSRESLKWWCVAGVAQGIAFWSKYTAILVPVALFLSLIVFPAHRARLREAGPYLATLIASIIFAPVLGWNADHSWISFTFQLQHGLTGSGGVGAILRNEGDLLGGQVGLVSPVVFVLMVVATARMLRTNRNDVSAPLATIGIAVLAFFVYSATKRRVEANWPALAYVPGTILLAAYSVKHATPRWKKWFTGGFALAAVISVVTYVQAIVPVLPLRAARDPAARASGWSELAQRVSSHRATIDAASTQPSASATHSWIAANRYQEASELAFHLPDHPPALSLNIDSRPNNYDLWPGFDRRAAKGDNLILVVDDLGEGKPHPAVERVAAHFASQLPSVPVVLARNGDPVKYLRIWTLTGWRGTWPESPVRSEP